MTAIEKIREYVALMDDDGIARLVYALTDMSEKCRYCKHSTDGSHCGIVSLDTLVEQWSQDDCINGFREWLSVPRPDFDVEERIKRANELI